MYFSFPITIDFRVKGSAGRNEISERKFYKLGGVKG